MKAKHNIKATYSRDGQATDANALNQPAAEIKVVRFIQRVYNKDLEPIDEEVIDLIINITPVQ